MLDKECEIDFLDSNANHIIVSTITSLFQLTRVLFTRLTAALLCSLLAASWQCLSRPPCCARLALNHCCILFGRAPFFVSDTPLASVSSSCLNQCLADVDNQLAVFVQHQ